MIRQKKHGSQGQGLFSLYNYIETTGQSLMLLGRNVALVTFYQDCSSRNDTSKNMAGRGRGLLSLYIYTENFKILLVRNQVYSSCHDSSKNMATRGRGFVSLYSYIKHFKNLFVRNHGTDFNITWQKCSFGDPLSGFSSSRHDALNYTAARGQGYKIYKKILEQ